MKAVKIISFILFLIGFLFSGFFINYTVIEEYTEDVLIIDRYMSGASGATYTCAYTGVRKSDGKKTSVDCKYMKAEHIKGLDKKELRERIIMKKNGAYAIPIYVTPRGVGHIWSEKEQRMLPGAKRLPILSYQTFLMLPFVFLLSVWIFTHLFNLLKRLLL